LIFQFTFIKVDSISVWRNLVNLVLHLDVYETIQKMQLVHFATAYWQREF